MVLPLPGPAGLPTGIPGVLPGAPPGLPPIGPGQLLGPDRLPAQPRQAEPKPPRRKKPTEERISAKADRIIDYWRGRDDRMDEDEKLYRLSREGFVGHGELVLRNLPFVLVEKAAALLGKQQPRIEVIPPRLDLRDEAQQMEDFLRYQWVVWGDEYADTLHNALRRDIAHFLALRGWAALRIHWDSEAEETGADNPIRLIPYDPRQVYPAIGARGLTYVVHHYQTTIEDLIDEWPEAEKLYADREDREELVEVTAYYDDWYHMVRTEEGIIKPVTAHEYGFVPWIIGIGMGAPIRATKNNTTDWVKDVGVSIFHGIKDSLKQLNKVLSQMATEVSKSANPPIIHYYDPANPEVPKRLKYHAGAVNLLMYDRERVEPLHLSPNPRDAGPLVEVLSEDINLGGLPPILWGVSGGSSGYQQALMADAAEDALFPLVEAMTRIIRLANQRALMLVRDLATGPVGYRVKDQKTGHWVGGVTLDPETVEEVGTENRVMFRNISPRDRMQLAQLAAMLSDKKLISLHTARDEYLGIENPERENELVLADLMYLDEDVTKVFTEMALAKADPEAHLIYTTAKAQAASPPAGAPPDGPPGEPSPFPQPPGLPPHLAPPIQQAAAVDPLALLRQSLASAAGGAGVQLPPGVPGAGAIARPPVIPGL